MGRFRRWLAVVSPLWLVVALLATPNARGEVAADTEARGPAPDAITQTEASVGCSLVPTDSPETEFASCLRVDATLDRALSVGESGTLTVDVFSQVSGPGEVTIDVPAGLEVLTGPGASGDLRRARSGFGEMAPRVVAAEFQADASVRFTFGVRALAAGPAPIEVRATVEMGTFTDGAMDIAYLTIGDGIRAALLSVEGSTAGGVAQVQDAPVAPAPTGEFVAVPLTEMEPVNDDTPPNPLAPESCVTGRFGYYDPNSDYIGVPNYMAQAWDVDTFSEDDLLAGGLTNGAGYFTLCWTEADGEFEGTDAQEVYVKFRSENALWRVQDATQTVYNNSTPTQSVPAGDDYDFGSMFPNSNLHRGMHAFHMMNNLWVWGHDPNPPYCFDWNETTCRQMTIEWYVGSTTGNWYSGNTIYIVEAGPDDEEMVLHETGHAAMDDVYNDDMPPNPNCNPHGPGTASSLGCAWTEGFASWVPVVVRDDPSDPWHWTWENLTWTWPPLYDGGLMDEGAITGAMNDVTDTAVAPEDHWDEWSEPAMTQWELFQDWALYGDGMPPDTYEEFWTDRDQAGLNVVDANACNYQNTIDFNFRDRLTAYVEKTRPTPLEDDHRYVVVNTSALNDDYWSAVAIRPDADFDLYYYANFDQTDLLAYSRSGGTSVDLIAVDNGHRLIGEFGLWDYPRVTQWSGIGDYAIEWAAGKTVLWSQEALGLSASDVVVVRDVQHVGGVEYYYRAAPAAGQDIDLYLFDSDPTMEISLVQAGGDALETGMSAGPGSSEAFTASTPTTDWLGLVLINQNGAAGTVDVYRDHTAPSGSVVIDGGAASTSSPAVTVSVSASDLDTGILDMRVSTDGVFDTEPWEPYVPTRAVSLPGDLGNKTVTVEFRNNAGMGTVASDTIAYGPVGATASRDSVALGDVDGDGHGELAVLLSELAGGRFWVVTRDTADGGLVSVVALPSTADALDLEATSSGELVVLYETTTNGFFRIRRFDAASGSAVGSVITLGSVFAYSDLEVTPAGELAVVGTSTVDGRVRVRVDDPGVGFTNYTVFGSVYSDGDLEVTPAGELAVMGARPDGVVRVRLVDPSDASHSSYIFGKAYSGDDLEVTGTELLVMGTRPADGLVRVRRVDSGSGLGTNERFGTAFSGVDLEALSTGEVAVLGERASDEQVRVAVQNGGLIAHLYGKPYTCMDLVETADGELAVLGEKRTTGDIRVRHIDPSTSAVTDLFYP